MLEKMRDPLGMWKRDIGDPPRLTVDYPTNSSPEGIATVGWIVTDMTAPGGSTVGLRPPSQALLCSVSPSPLNIPHPELDCSSRLIAVITFRWSLILIHENKKNR